MQAGQKRAATDDISGDTLPAKRRATVEATPISDFREDLFEGDILDAYTEDYAQSKP